MIMQIKFLQNIGVVEIFLGTFKIPRIKKTQPAKSFVLFKRLSKLVILIIYLKVHVSFCAI